MSSTVPYSITKSTLEHAIIFNHFDLFKYLFEQQTKSEDFINSVFRVVVQHPRLSFFSYMLPYLTSSTAILIFRHACAGGSMEILDRLLLLHDFSNELDCLKSGIKKAISRGHLGVIQKLCSIKQDLYKTDTRNMIELSKSAWESNNSAVIRYVLGQIIPWDPSSYHIRLQGQNVKIDDLKFAIDLLIKVGHYEKDLSRLAHASCLYARKDVFELIYYDYCQNIPLTEIYIMLQKLLDNGIYARLAIIVFSQPKCTEYRRLILLLIHQTLFNIAISLVELPLPIIISVVDETCPIAVYVPFHIKWNMISAIKHSPLNKLPPRCS